MKCDNCKKEVSKKFSYSLPEKTYGNRKALVLCCKNCLKEKIEELEEKYGRK